MSIPRTIIALLAASMLSLIAAVTVPAHETKDEALFVNADDLSWQNAPPSLPKGAKMSVLLGDPAKPGHFVLRLTTPGEYIIPPHFHSRAETLTVLSGTLFLGNGTTYDPVVAHQLNVGGFHYLPAKAPHFAFSKKPTIVEVHGEGPFDIFYLNPKDDPQKAH